MQTRSFLSLAGLAASSILVAPAAAQVTVSDIEPTFAAAPLSVDVTGSGFTPATEVFVDGLPATVLSRTATTLTIVPQPSDPGFLDVTVVDGGQSDSLPGGAQRYPTLAVGNTGLGGQVTIDIEIGDAGIWDLALGVGTLPAPLPLDPSIAYGLLLDPGLPLVDLGSGLALSSAPEQLVVPAPSSAALLGVPFGLQLFTQAGLIGNVSFSFSNLATLLFTDLAFGPPANLVYADPSPSYLVGSPIDPNLASVDGPVEVFEVADLPQFGFGPLPTGLTLDPSNGTLSGTPTGPGGTTDHLIVANNAAGSTSTPISITIQDIPVGPPGSVGQKPGSSSEFEGGAFVFDPNGAGQGAAPVLVEALWGRLVDVYDTAPGGQSRLVFADFLAGENVVQGPGTPFGAWTYDNTSVSGRAAIRVALDSSADPQGFESVLTELTGGLVPVAPKGVDEFELPPFSVVPRNAALALRFSDLLDEATVVLGDTVRVTVGGGFDAPFDARVLPDGNFGGVAAVDGLFHTTRVLVDFTVTPSELASVGGVLPVNGLGLPEGDGPSAGNVALRVPTVVAPGVGQFAVLSGINGLAVDAGGSGPLDLASPTLDVVRSFASGSDSEPNGGFLLDLTAPRILGAFDVTLTALSEPSPGSVPTTLVGDLTFPGGPCALDPRPGDQLQLAGSVLLEVTGGALVVGGTASAVQLRPLAIGGPLPPLPSLLGPAQLQTAWDPLLGASVAPCFVRFTPTAAALPDAGVAPEAQSVFLFSEPMDRDGIDPFETLVLTDDAGVDPSATSGAAQADLNDLIVADVLPSADLTQFALTPILPLKHAQGQSETYFLRMLATNGERSIADLAGNALTEPLPLVPFTVDVNAPTEDTGSWALRFKTFDDDDILGPEIRGQVLYDALGGRLLPRPVQRFALNVDRNQPIVGDMQQVTTGLQTPLASLGSKAHLTWRYVDAGLSVSQKDGTFADLDLEGISLSPVGGSVSTAFYDEFEMRLGYGKNTPDEVINPASLLPDYPNSGFSPIASFAENFLLPEEVVHPRELGFAVSPIDVFQSSTGVPMLPMPWNRGLQESEKTFFTWRDTAITELAGVSSNGDLIGAGVPLEQEVLVLGSGQNPGEVYGAGGFYANGVAFDAGLPSIALPLVTEYRCYPSESPSLNNFDVSIAATSSSRPFFRAFSTGGFNTAGVAVIKDPDLEDFPTGGFNGNPQIGPIGQPTTPRDPSVYIGQMDAVVRLSRAHTILIDAEQQPGAFTSPSVSYDYVTPLTIPRPAQQPEGTALVFAFRGDDSDQLVPGFDGDVFNADDLDVYGNVATGPLTGQFPEFPLANGLDLSQPDWSDDIDAVDGLRFVQVRLTFVGNTETLETPSLDALGVAFRR